MNSCKCLVAVLSICFFAECTDMSAAQTTANPNQKSTNTHDVRNELLARYRGLLPCADCPGIDTVLSLFTKSPKDLAPTRYLLKRTYQDRGNTIAEAGTWTVLRGTPDNPDATVYQLKSSAGGQVTNFLRVSDDEILQLDSERRRIDAKLNFSLQKIAPKASPTHTPNGD
jgi:copper homeostasis protein (lipoprotein)